MIEPGDHARLDAVVDLMAEYVSGNLSARLATSPHNDQLDTIVAGMHLLADELIAAYAELESRVAERTESLRQAQADLERLALQDPLTGLANRTLLGDRIAQALSWSEETGNGPPSVLLLDLDGFKTINDSLGHTAGDAVLVEIARRLTSVARPTDTVARLGGDEFAIVMPDTDGDAADAWAQAALDVLKEPVNVHGRSVWALASIGIRAAEPGETPDVLLRDADTAMYAAKSGGRGRFFRYRPVMHHAVQRRLRVVSELGNAIHASQLRLSYQPIVDLHSNELTGVEALVRWHHPHRGLIMPDEFITVAEDSGLVVDLGRWVSENAIGQLVQWGPHLQDKDDFRVHLNVSPVELRRPGLADFLQATLVATGIDPRRLALEISESALMTEDVNALEALRGLEQLGASLEIDDFGTGYSSIAYLRRLPIDTVKLDRALIRDLATDTEQARFVGAILKLIESVGLTAVVEGVETAEQAELLRQLGATKAQGYFYGRPMPAAELAGRFFDPERP